MEPCSTTPSKPGPQMSMQPNQVMWVACGTALQLISPCHLALHGLSMAVDQHPYGRPPGLMRWASILAERWRQLAQKRGPTP